MKTFLPHRQKSGANSDDEGGTDDISRGANVDYLELCMRTYPEARRRAVFSIIPGIGQFKNGEYGKGALFLTVTLANLALVVAVSMSDSLTKSLTGIAVSLHRQPNFDLATPLQGVVQSPALFIYIALVVTFVCFAVRDAYDSAVQSIRAGEKPEKYNLALPEAASSSYLAHFIIMSAMVLAVIFFITPVPPKQQVTVIELVQPEKIPEPKRPEPKREQPKPKAEPKPVVVPKPVVRPPVRQVVPPKVIQPVAVATPTNEPTPFTAAPVSAPPAADPTPAPTGPAGGSGTGSGGGDGGSGQDVDMGPYMRELQRKIKRAWYPPKGNENKKIKVSFKVFKDGHIAKVKLITSSGVSTADDAATQAVSDAAPFAALPEGAGTEVDINFSFDYNVFGARR